MSNLNNLTSKILNDAKEEADKIVKSAEEKAKQKYDLEIKKAIAKKQTLLENARRERELLSDRIKSSANLKARNEKLKAKQTVINKVIDKLKAKLVNMNESDYINYLNQNIDKSSIAGKELIVKKEFVEKIYKIKKRDFSKKIIALINDRKILKDLVNETEEDMKKFSKIFDECWPGELTVIFRANCDFTKKFDEKMKTIGIRIPKNKIALEIIEKSGGVVLTTSANISGESAVKRIEDLSKELIKNVDIIISNEKSELTGKPSTIVKFENGGLTLLREGNILFEEIVKKLK